MACHTPGRYESKIVWQDAVKSFFFSLLSGWIFHMAHVFLFNVTLVCGTPKGKEEILKKRKGIYKKLKERFEILQYIEDTYLYMSLNCFFNSIKTSMKIC